MEFFYQNRGKLLEQNRKLYDEFCRKKTGHEASEGHREEEGRISHRKRTRRDHSHHASSEPSRKDKSHRSYSLSHKDNAEIHKGVPTKTAPPPLYDLQHQGIRDEVRAIFGPTGGGSASSPFVADIRDYPFPKSFKMPDGIPEYNGDADPMDYMNAFQYSMGTVNAKDPIMCKTFPIYLRGKARGWFDDLPQASISNFTDSVKSFLTRFYQQKN